MSAHSGPGANESSNAKAAAQTLRRVSRERLRYMGSSLSENSRECSDTRSGAQRRECVPYSRSSTRVQVWRITWVQPRLLQVEGSTGATHGGRSKLPPLGICLKRRGSLVESIATLRRILSENRRIAVVGLSARPHRPSYFAAKYLLDHGYEVIPVNPAYEEVLGQRCYPDLTDIP